MSEAHIKEEYNEKLLKELEISNANGEPTENIKVLFSNLAILEIESERYNFVSDYYKSKLVDKGYERCLFYMSKFNPERSDRPSAYFTIVLRSTYIRDIHKKRKEQSP